VPKLPTDGSRARGLWPLGQTMHNHDRDTQGHDRPEQAWRFDDVEVRTRPIGVKRGDRMIGVEPKAHAVLLVLLSRSGEAVEREALLDTVWGHRHVTPSVLNRIVAQLRRALGDDASHPRYIQTLHGRGYRFMVQPERTDADDDATIAGNAIATPGPAARHEGHRRQ
jgi:DNA-binding winged helix-turn-helix (wHTH) protein